jgi:hypothetical protein
MNPNVEEVRKRLKEGASDAELRLELLTRGLSVEDIANVMREAAPRVSVDMPYLVVGLGTLLLALGLLATQITELKENGHFRHTKVIAVLASVGVGVLLRSFTRRK